MRTIIVGDVHGCLYELKALLKKLQYTSKDRLIFVGDLINKGPFSLKTLQFVHSLKAECLLGNHEMHFLDYLKKKRSMKYKALISLKEEMNLETSFWKDWLSKLPLYIEEDHFLVVHAGLKPHTHPSQTPRHILTTIRTWSDRTSNLKSPSHPPWYEFYKDSKPVIFGHWSRKGLIEKPNVIGLDSGCVYGGQLSAVCFPEKKIHQVPSLKNYSLIYGEKQS